MLFGRDKKTKTTIDMFFFYFFFFVFFVYSIAIISIAVTVVGQRQQHHRPLDPTHQVRLVIGDRQTEKGVSITIALFYLLLVINY